MHLIKSNTIVNIDSFFFCFPVSSPLLSPTDNIPSPTMSPIFAEFDTVQGRAQLASLRCQQLCQTFDEQLEFLKNELEMQSNRFMSELEDVEVWIQNAYTILRQEPAREIEGVYTQQEIDAEEEEVMSQRSQEVAEGGGSGDGVGSGGLMSGRFSGTPDLFSSGEFLPSDGSLGSEGLVGSLEERKVHDTSVDPDLSDDEYNRQVLDRVISPEPEGAAEDTSVDDKEYNVGFSLSMNEVSKRKRGGDVGGVYAKSYKVHVRDSLWL